MVLLTVFLPFVNFLLFVMFGSLVSRQRLATYVIFSMGCSLLFLLLSLPQIVGGHTPTASLGT
jgi:NADH:ubiquinone oxidoreductase subunit 5 (subunit L)/multisubunit Na+/H+ antiporter MnhA subunit